MSDEEIAEGQDQASPSTDHEGLVPRPYGMPGGGVDDSFSSAARLLDSTCPGCGTAPKLSRYLRDESA